MNQQVDPAKIPCPDCGSERVWTITEGGSFLAVKPIGAIFGVRRLNVLVCTGCGLSLLYHPEPLQAVKRRPDKPIKHDRSDG